MNRLRAGQVNFWYYRDQRAREVDFVLEHGGSLRLVECKWREHPEASDARHLLSVREEIARSGSAWKPGPSWVIGTPAASYSLAEGLTAGALRDLSRVLAADRE